MVRLLILVAAAHPLGAAPRRPAPAALAFDFPTATGTTWVYAEGDEETTEAETDVQAADRATVVTVAEVRGERKLPRRRIVVTDKALSQSALLNGEASEPRCVLRLPVRAGDRWDYHVDADSPQFDETQGSCRTAGEEEVVVPAGRFRAVRVDTEVRRADGGTHLYTAWLAPGVRYVKREVRKDGKATRTIVLKSFAPAK